MSETNPKTIHLAKTPPAYSGLIGVARRDITPPVGIYSRLWGAAKHDVAEGVHRQLTATAVAIRTREDNTTPPLVLVSIDCAHLGDGSASLDRVLRALSLPLSSLMIACTHTHSSPWMSRDRESLPGGQLLAEYRHTLTDRIVEAAREAIDSIAPATLTWETGRCALAVNRDQPDLRPSPSGAPRFVCGFNSDVRADDTLLVGRITRDADDAIIGTIVNYACHPTTLGWENRLLSPDYVGAMREIVETATRGAPCAFLQGSSGELSPAWQYVGDVAVADQHGRALGFAVLSILNLMLAPRRELRYEGVMESGTALGMWRPHEFQPSTELRIEKFDVALPLKSIPTPIPEPEADAAKFAAEDRVQDERNRRRAWVREHVGKGTTMAIPVWAWRVGTSVFIGMEGEAYSIFQRELRAHFPKAALCVIGVVNGGGVGYLHPPEVAKQDLYQVWQSPFEAGALPMLTRACEDRISKLFAVK